MLTRNQPDQERMQQLCSLAAAGELSLRDRIVLQKHLKVCPQCRELLKDLQEIALFDLSAIGAERLANQVADDLESGNEEISFSQLVEKARELHLEENCYSPSDSIIVPPCPVPLWKRLRKSIGILYPITGWVFASLALFGSVIYVRHNKIAVPMVVSDSTDLILQADMNQWRTRALTAEKQANDIGQNLTASLAQAQAASQSLAQAKTENWMIVGQEEALQSQVAQQDAKLREDAATLSLKQASLDDARSDAASLRAQMQELNARFEKQRTEMAQLREVAATTPARMPSSGGQIGDNDAKAILEARDLHVVDVFDVDHAGNSSKIYGRVYYVDHRFLLFYAFDLGQSEKGRRPVAFQAWGYRQPDSRKAQSLGLFYLEDPKVDRWTLRVSDPHLLEGIDTLFVTIEPPSGSKIPRGRQLLLASLAGPPNHP